MSLKLIATTTVGSGGAASIDFDNIPATYTDLYLLVSARGETSNSNACQLYFNNTTSNYSWRRLSGDGSSAFSDSTAGGGTTSYIRHIGTNPANYTASTFGSINFYIPNYAGSTNKSVSGDGVTENNATESIQTLIAGLWSNTAAITRVTIIPDSGDFNEHSVASLYGITKGSDGIVTTS
jgi:hypothetical protein